MDRIKNNLIMYQRIILLMIGDILAIISASFLSILVRLDFYHIDWVFWANYLDFVFLDILITLIIFSLFNMYRSMWKFASMV
ncbi:MAG: polysaccharide biosynthesis protein, partial [Traorella sp.]